MFCRLVTGQEATCSAWNHDFVAIPAHLMVLHQHLSPCFARPMAMGGGDAGGDPVWLGGRGHLGGGWGEGVDAENPRGLLEDGREQSVCSAQKVLSRFAAELSGR